jgi:tRNA pseudouridine32 synthase/23S rRNA pseudouridine746 synthase
VTVTPEEIIARLLYRDGLMLVIDKPAGFAVHKGPKGGESLEDYFGALRFGLPRAPALAHRLDRDTSGCLVLGRHRKALAELGRLFKSGRIAKTYWALVEGGPAEDEGRIDLPLGRKDATRGWWMKHDPQGQPAVTTWKVLARAQLPSGSTAQAVGTDLATSSSPPPCGEGLGVGVDRVSSSESILHHPPPHPSPTRGEGADRASGKDVSQPAANASAGHRLTWLALEPLTGRTHQLRVHCAAMGWPILGDSVYGGAPRAGGPGLHLHAREIMVPLYKNRAPIQVIAPVPPHMQSALRRCGWRDDASG